MDTPVKETIYNNNDNNNDDNINSGNVTFKATLRRNGLTLVGSRKQSLTLYGNQNLQNTTDTNTSEMIYSNTIQKFQHSFLPDDYYVEEIERFNLKFPENLKFKEINNGIV